MALPGSEYAAAAPVTARYRHRRAALTSPPAKTAPARRADPATVFIAPPRCHQRSISAIAGTERGRPRHSHGCQNRTVRQEALNPTAAKIAIWRMPGKGASIIIRYAATVVSSTSSRALRTFARLCHGETSLPCHHPLGEIIERVVGPGNADNAHAHHQRHQV